jgi:hypothetical protein
MFDQKKKLMEPICQTESSRSIIKFGARGLRASLAVFSKRRQQKPYVEALRNCFIWFL